jgi:cellulose synthase/poly-beta-1,6-N-acetylglucosamine synthase-like glycosyltransferase
MNLIYWQWIIIGILCLVLIIQMFYYLYFFVRLAFHKPKPRTTSHTHPVSVIICARDEAANLVKNLPGSLVQEYRTTHEVIVVNDNSFDDSKYLLEEFQKQFRQLHVVELKQEAKLIPGKKFPLSMGIKAAKYEIVLLTDADCVPASEFWIDSMQAAYTDETEIMLGYGAFHKVSGLLNKLIRWETLHSAIQYLSYALAGMAYMGVGRNLSYKKSVFFRHKGFSAHNHVASGDDDLFINMAATASNTAINIQPEAFTLSQPAKTFGEWVGQKTRHYSTSKHYKAVHKCLLALYAFTHFLIYPAILTTALLVNWQWALIALGFRWLLLFSIFTPVAKKLKETDLLPWLPIFDMGMFIYYFVFSFAIFKKPRTQWK